MSYFHEPVLLQEAVEYLNVQPGKKYIDATIGGGGHAVEILKRGGRVLGTDLDPEALDAVKLKVQSSKLKVNLGKDLILARGNFAEIGRIARENNFENVSGVLFDLGMSSYQIEHSGRGFSFKRCDRLDMRFDPSATSGLTAEDIVNTYSEEELYDIFSKYGEEEKALEIAQAVVRARKKRAIKTTFDLAKIIEEVLGRQWRIHSATQVFQALRIAVNNELENLKEGLRGAISILESHGRLVVISFHSLEDRIVKMTFNKWEAQGAVKLLIKKPIFASEAEIRINKRARSAKLRAVEKVWV